MKKLKKRLFVEQTINDSFRLIRIKVLYYLTILQGTFYFISPALTENRKNLSIGNKR